MTSDAKKRSGDVAAAAGRRKGAWSLNAEKLARRVPRFAAFVDGPQGSDSELTREQREFLDKFSAGLSDAESAGDAEAG